jgi:CRP/FNR family transcriptional regulator
MPTAAAARQREDLRGCVAVRGNAGWRPGESAAARQCATCNLHEACFALCPRALEPIGVIPRRFAKGDSLFRPGDPFTALYMIRAGSWKTLLLTENGREQVAAFHLRGEFIGVDGIGVASHHCEAIALEDSEVCAMPYQRLEALSRRDGDVQRALYGLLASETRRQHSVMLMLGTMRSEQRLAAFLLDLSRRQRDLGDPVTILQLRMTRDEIGSYVGLKLETVSRLFSHLQQLGLLQVEGRTVKLLDIRGLERVVASGVQ